MNIAEGMLLGVLFVASLQDIEEKALPNRIPAFLFLLGLFSSVSGISLSPLDAALGALAGLMTMLAIATLPVWVYGLFWLIGKKDWFLLMFGPPVPTLGGGDIKLFTAIGLFLGWKLTLIAIFFSYVAGAIMGLYAIFVHNADRKTYIPLIPGILAGTWTALLFGEEFLRIITQVM